jgi:hypothetical protein
MKKPVKKHHTFAYSVDAIAAGASFKDAVTGDDLAIRAWLGNVRGWWSYTLKFYGFDGETLEVGNVSTNGRSDSMRGPHDVTHAMHQAIDEIKAAHEGFEGVASMVMVTYSLVKPKSVYGQCKGVVA